MSINNIFRLGGVIIVGVGAIAFASEYPKSRDERIRQEMGSVLGEKGIVFSNSNLNSKAKIDTKPVQKGERKVNKYLWEAARYVLKFMPITSYDHANGVIITDWYTTNTEPNYSYKIEVTITDNVISADAIEVNVYEKKLKKGQWYNEPMSTTLSYKFEDQILRKAREIYLKTKEAN